MGFPGGAVVNNLPDSAGYPDPQRKEKIDSMVLCLLRTFVFLVKYFSVLASEIGKHNRSDTRHIVFQAYL